MSRVLPAWMPYGLARRCLLMLRARAFATTSCRVLQILHTFAAHPRIQAEKLCDLVFCFIGIVGIIRKPAW